MAIKTIVVAGKSYNDGAWHAVDNPYGLGQGGHRENNNFINLLLDLLSDVGTSTYTQAQVNALFASPPATGIGNVTPRPVAATTLSATSGLTVTGGGAAITGNSTVTGTLGVASDLTVANTTAGLRLRSGGATDADVYADGSATNIALNLSSKGGSAINFRTAGGTRQFQVTDTASANRYVTITGSNGSFPIIDSTAGPLMLRGGGQNVLRLDGVASTVNYILMTGQSTGNSPTIQVAGETNAGLFYYVNGTGSHVFCTGGGRDGAQQVHIQDTVGATRYLTLTGSNGGSPVLGTSAGDLALTPAGGGVGLSFAGDARFYAAATNANSSAYLRLTGRRASVDSTFSIVSAGDGLTTAGLYVTLGDFTGARQFAVLGTASATNYITVTGSNANDPVMSTNGGALTLNSANGYIAFQSAGSRKALLDNTGVWSFGNASAWSLRVSPVASATRWVTIAGSNGGNPTISSSAGSLSLTASGEIEGFRILALGGTVANYFWTQPAGATGSVSIGATGSDTNVNLHYRAKGASALHRFFVNDNNLEILRLSSPASAVNYATIAGNATGGGPTYGVDGSDTNITINYRTKGTGAHSFSTDGGNSNIQLVINHVASANRRVEISGSNGGNPTIDTSAGALLLKSGGVQIAALNTAGIGSPYPILAMTGTAIPAGGTAGAGFLLSSTSNFGVFFGSGAPTLSAAKGSIYLRSDGSTTNDRMYVNTNGSTTWTAVTTAA